MPDPTVPVPISDLLAAIERNPQVALAFVEYVQANEQRIALLSMARPDIESLRDALLRFEAARARLFGLLGEAT